MVSHSAGYDDSLDSTIRFYFPARRLLFFCASVSGDSRVLAIRLRFADSWPPPKRLHEANLSNVLWRDLVTRVLGKEAEESVPLTASAELPLYEMAKKALLWPIKPIRFLNKEWNDRSQKLEVPG
jgi:hypothetical protein